MNRNPRLGDPGAVIVRHPPILLPRKLRAYRRFLKVVSPVVAAAGLIFLVSALTVALVPFLIGAGLCSVAFIMYARLSFLEDE